MWVLRSEGCRRWIVATFCLAAVLGCANTRSGIDPTGEHIFVQPTAAESQVPPNQLYHDEPLGRLPSDDVAVQLQPQETVAPVGTEVVLIAGVVGSDSLLRTNRRLEWTITQGSVGQFVDVEKNGFVDWMLGDFNHPRKVSNTYAIGSTSRDSIRLNRGAATPENNVHVLRGQGWITVTSPIEGTTNVTVLAPEVYGWDARIKSGAIHWIDAQWRYPPPAIKPAGSKHVLTTVVMRQTNPSPCENWRVRYEILDGPSAGFSPDGAASIEVPTDSAGQANAEIFQKQAGHGTNRVCVQIVRPGDLPGANGRRLVVGSGTSAMSWTAADLCLHMTGPTVGSVGATLTYRIVVANPGDLPTKDVVVTEKIAEGLTYASSNPPAEVAGQQLQWRFGDLGARQQHCIEVNFRAERPGCVNNGCEASAAGGMKVTDCVATTIGAAGGNSPQPGAPASAGPASSSPAGTSPLDIRITPATMQAAVGDHIAFEISVVNRGLAPAKGLTIKDRFDAGLELEPPVAEAAAKRSIEAEVGEIPPNGRSRSIKVEFRVTQPGKLCHTVEVGGPSTPMASRQVCVTVSAPVSGGAAPLPGTPAPAAQPTAPPVTAPPVTAPPAAKPSLSVKLNGPTQGMTVGEIAQFTIRVSNNGSTLLRNVKIVDSFDPALVPTLATDGHRLEGNDLSWTIDTLGPGKATEIGIHCKCQSPAVKAINRVRVDSAEGIQASDEVGFEIRIAGVPPVSPNPPADKPPTTPPPEKPAAPEKPATPENPPPAAGELTMDIPGLHNPVAVGKSVIYRIQVTNNSAQSYKQVTLTATLPKGIVPAAIGTQGPGGTPFQVEAGKVKFNPVMEVRAGESLVYEVRGVARQAGQGQFHAELSSPDLKQAIVKDIAAEAVQ